MAAPSSDSSKVQGNASNVELGATVQPKEDEEVKESDDAQEWTVDECDLAQMFNGYVNSAQIIDVRSLSKFKRCHIHRSLHVDTGNVEESGIRPKRRNILFDSKDSKLGVDDYKKVYDRCRALKESCSFLVARQQFDFEEFGTAFPSICLSAENEKQISAQQQQSGGDDVDGQHGQALDIMSKMMNGGDSSDKRVGFPNLILPHELYLGDMWDRRAPDNLKEVGITHIVDATMEKFDPDDAFSVFKIRLPDTPQAASQMAAHFEKAVEFMKEALRNKKHRVFVHCQMGISRSTTLVLAYLMMARRFTLYEGYTLCQKSRPRIRPNDGFFEQLKALEMKVHGKSTADLIEKEGLRNKSECLIM